MQFAISYGVFFGAISSNGVCANSQTLAQSADVGSVNVNIRWISIASCGPYLSKSPAMINDCSILLAFCDFVD